MTILSLPKQREDVPGPERADTGWCPGDWYAGLTFGLSTWRFSYQTVVIQVSGEVDTATSPLLTAEIVAYLRSGARAIVLDLREVTFLGCSGLKALLGAREDAARSGTAMSLMYESTAVRRPLVLLGLTDLFHTVTGWDAALTEEKAAARMTAAEDL